MLCPLKLHVLWMNLQQIFGHTTKRVGSITKLRYHNSSWNPSGDRTTNNKVTVYSIECPCKIDPNLINNFLQFVVESILLKHIYLMPHLRVLGPFHILSHNPITILPDSMVSQRKPKRQSCTNPHISPVMHSWNSSAHEQQWALYMLSKNKKWHILDLNP